MRSQALSFWGSVVWGSVVRDQLFGDQLLGIKCWGSVARDQLFGDQLFGDQLLGSRLISCQAKPWSAPMNPFIKLFAADQDLLITTELTWGGFEISGAKMFRGYNVY